MSAAMAAALRSAPRSLLASSLAPRRALSSARRLSAAPTSSLSASLFSLSSSRLLKALPRRLSARQQDLHFSAGMLNLSTAELIAATTSANRVVVFSKSTCPFCHKAKGILKAQGVDDAIVFETDQGEVELEGSKVDPTNIRAVIASEFSHRTVPAIFINGKLIGGASELDELYQSGELGNMLDAKAL